MTFCGISDANTPFQPKRYDPPRLDEWDLLPYNELVLDYRYDLDAPTTTNVWLTLACRDMNMAIIPFT